MLATQGILCVTIIGNAALLLVVLRERASPVRITFALYLASIAGWAFAIYANLFLRSLLVEDWIFATAAGVLTAQLWFAKIFPDGENPKKLRGYWSLAVGYAFILLSFYPGALFTSITVHQQGYTTLDSGPFSIAYSLFALVYVCGPMIILWRKYALQEEGLIRRQLLYLSIGFTIFVLVAVSTNSILPVFFHFYALNAFGPAFSLVFASTAFFITWRYKFLDIRKALQRGAIYTVLIVSMLAAYVVFLAETERYLESIKLFSWVHADDVLDPLTAILVTALGISILPSLEHFFQKVTNRIFFKERYDYALAIESLSRILAENVEFDRLVEQIEENLARILRAEFAEVLLYDDERGVDSQDPHAKALANREMLSEPIVMHGKQIGCIALGEKSSGDRYTLEDEKLLRTFSVQASTALARVQLFQEVQRHAIELEGKVSERTEELRQAHERQRHLMLDIAHGFQTPLAVFRTKLERSKSIGADTRELERSLTELSEFVEDLLKLARLEHAEPPRFEPLALSELINDLCDEATIVATASRIEITREIEPGISIHADARELSPAIMNLIANSVKYMRRGDPRQIFVRLSREGGKAIFTIRDTGIGIESEDLSHIFDRFYRANRPEGIAGSGLGLAISRAVFARHGGSIEARSTLGKGTTMVVRLPCAAPAESAA